MIGHVDAEVTGPLLDAPSQTVLQRTGLLAGVSSLLLLSYASGALLGVLSPVAVLTAVGVASPPGMCANGFPADFIWGLGTASYQIEGGVNLTGRQPSIWDSFSHEAGRIMGGDTGDVADNVIHSWREDVRLMHELGLKHYRFSLSWSRMMSWDGTRMVPNEAGIAWYAGFIDELLAVGIAAHVTLYHWDLPQALHDFKGGWHTPDNTAIIDEFDAYAALAFERFGSVVDTWFTFNEPWSFAVSGYSLGNHAPGCVPKQLNGPCANGDTMPYIVSTNVLNAHARAVDTYRRARLTRPRLQAFRPHAKRPHHHHTAHISDCLHATQTRIDCACRAHAMIPQRPCAPIPSPRPHSLPAL